MKMDSGSVKTHPGWSGSRSFIVKDGVDREYGARIEKSPRRFGLLVGRGQYINCAKRWALTEEALLEEKREMRMTAQLQEILAELRTGRAALVNYISYKDSVITTPKWVDMFARERLE